MCKPKGGVYTYVRSEERESNCLGRILLIRQTEGIVRFIRLFPVEKEREKKSFRIDNLLADFELVRKVPEKS